MNTRLVRHDVEAAFGGASAEPRSPTPVSPDASINGGLSICLQTSDMDRALAALTIANGAAAMGQRVRVYFAFWGVTVLARRPNPDAPLRRRMLARCIAWLSGALRLPKLNLLGIGPAMLRLRMRAKAQPGVEEQLEMAREFGVEIFVCDSTLDMFGLEAGDLDPAVGFQLCGVSTFVDHALDSKQTLFI